MGRLVDNSTIVHSYPFCWRSDTPLIYKACLHLLSSACNVCVFSERYSILRAV